MSDPTRADLDALIARLSQGGLQDLAARWVAWSLDRPAHEVLDVERLSDLVVAALDAGAQSPRLESWWVERVKAARAAVPKGTARPHVPEELLPPLTELLSRPLAPERALVRRLMRHEAVEELFRETLVGALHGFVARIRTMGLLTPAPFQEAAKVGFGRLKGVFGEARDGLLGGLSHEIERQAEAKIRDFVDAGIQSVLDEVAGHLSNPANAPRFAAWRVHMMDVLLDTELDKLARELDKMGPEPVVAATTGALRALSGRPAFRDEVRSALAAARDALGARTLRSVLEEGGISEAGWREPMEALLVAQLSAFVAAPVFRAWAGEWVVGEAKLQGD